jgi:serine/threonine protein kinase
MVMLVDIEPAYLAQTPIVRQRLRPCGIDDETRCLAGARCVVHAGLLEEPVKRAIVLQEIAIGIGGHDQAGQVELLEGQSLDRAHYRRPMPYPKLLDFGVQVADALDAAHRKGILHRDIKPGNIFLSPSGQVKILDFGLAKLEEGYASPNGAGGDKPNATMAEPFPHDLLTSPGSAVGTIAYMSPEQARGETLDGRSDVFSLGVVLYELATGQHPFTGSTTAVTFDRILNYAPTAPISLNPSCRWSWRRRSTRRWKRIGSCAASRQPSCAPT